MVGNGNYVNLCIYYIIIMNEFHFNFCSVVMRLPILILAYGFISKYFMSASKHMVLF